LMLRWRAWAVSRSCADGLPSTTAHDIGVSGAVASPVKAGFAEQVASRKPAPQSVNKESIRLICRLTI